MGVTVEELRATLDSCEGAQEIKLSIGGCEYDDFNITYHWEKGIIILEAFQLAAQD
jgi:hypothetical protein